MKKPQPAVASCIRCGCTSHVVREMLRTLSRMRRTTLVDAYWQLFSELAIELYGDEMRMFEHPGSDAPPALVLSESRRADLRTWLTNYPQFAFSLIVGLAEDDENAAWGLAYG